MNIFIDCGTNYGQGLNHFIDFLKIDNNWKIHSFEANPKISCERKPNVEYHNKAVWIKNGFVDFRQFGDDGQSAGSLIADTKGGEGYADHYGDIAVESIDFYEFVSQFKENDSLYIKMDIEHAEYDVLEDMIKKGWPKNIKEIWVEWHARTPGETNYEFFSGRKRKILESLKNCDTVIHEWH